MAHSKHSSVILIARRPLVPIVVAALLVSGAISPTKVSAHYIFEPPHKRGGYVRGRSVFINPVGKINKEATRRLPSLTVKPAEFDFGIKPITLESPAGSAARARRSSQSPRLSVPPKTGL